jgi:hypothetical protein
MIKRGICSLLLGGMLLVAAPQAASAHEQMDRSRHISCWEHRQRHERHEHHFGHEWSCRRW